ncbi:MAG: helix-turn-helix transcriptional regulator [Kordiimonadaceae bacterium]|nr:helix-turn-helix transcriptional regulator [Kordiimonadaceae bacterium]
MDIKASVIKAERQSRSWTQQHLADVCNLSLRTVQRVERFGSAAPETVMELCSVLEIEQVQLMADPEPLNVTRGAFISALTSPVIMMLGLLLLMVGLGLGAVLTYLLLQ